MSSSEPSRPLVGLVTDDLLFRSRVVAGLEGQADLVTVRLGALPDGLVLLLVDLNRRPEERIAGLSMGGGAGLEIICFGPHTEMAELSPRARAAGATRCVANSHLAETLQRWLRSATAKPSRAGGQP
ncbi:MAG TPA: hypothetical protein VI138_02090 [Candidatus Dormibacteraeota bacterium]